MWLVGIDEAGYGPNLGPLVMTSVACRVPGRRVRADLWKLLRKAVRRHDDENDDRLLVTDSKLVYTPARGLGPLERGVLGSVAGDGAPPGAELAHYVDWACPDHHAELRDEPWFTGRTRLPVSIDHAQLESANGRFAEVCAGRQISWGLIRSVVVCPARFNRLTERWGSKASVLGLGLAELLEINQQMQNDDDQMVVVVDKHGGRDYYSALVQHAFPDGMVLARREGELCSHYEVIGLARPVQVRFEPRADLGHFCVALASMLSKYLRELFMLEFNRFWQERVPGLEATAGYPGDSQRFYREIKPTARRLGIRDNTLWRQR